MIRTIQTGDRKMKNEPEIPSRFCTCRGETPLFRCHVHIRPVPHCNTEATCLLLDPFSQLHVGDRYPVQFNLLMKLSRRTLRKIMYQLFITYERHVDLVHDPVLSLIL